MKKSVITLSILAIVVGGCVQTGKKQTKIDETKSDNAVLISSKDYSKIKLIDRFENKLEKDSVTQKSEAQFSPLYIGDEKQEIELRYKTNKIGNRNKRWERDSCYNRPNTKSMTIVIDTSRIIGSPMDVWEYYKKTEYRNKKMSYPVFIENISTDTLDIGHGDILPIIIEAKDINGVWKPIQTPFWYDCVTGLTNFYLSPKQIAVTAMKIYAGNFKTKLRLSFGHIDNKIYSNEIDGYINIEQFE